MMASMFEHIRRATSKERSDTRQSSLYGAEHEQELKDFYYPRSLRHTKEPRVMSRQPVQLLHAKEGQRVNGVLVTEPNRATRYEYSDSEIAVLAKITKENYRDKGVLAELVAIPSSPGSSSRRQFKVAVYVEEGFLIPISRGFAERDSD